ncbi:MAG: peptide ABC transporter substrate-binding protein, partial [Chloroflexi bacterium]|nr:peptide ABC transporter substrate-binding protein [Chloroflexota bacterium]
MWKHKRILQSLATVFALALLASACTQAAPPAPPAAPGGAQQAAPAPAQASGAPPAAGAKGGTLRLLWNDPPTLDPALASDTDSAGIVLEVFSGLVALTPELKIVPDIAERWEVSPDAKTYTFHLRKNAKFQDGKPVTARDFKYSWERAADPATESTTVDLYMGDIVGVRDVVRGKAKEISGLKVVDDNTLQVTIDAPKAYFLAKMTYQVAAVVDRANVQSGKNWTQRANGTGPFKLREYSIGQRIVLARNDNYYREPMPKLDQVVYSLSGGTPMTMYENNEIDATGVGLADIDRVRDPKNPLNKDLITSPPEFAIYFVGFNVTKPPFDDVKVRQALTLVIDKESITKNVFSGLRVPAYGVLPPGLPGFNQNLKGLRYDPQKAKQLLAESKYAGKMPRITLSVPGTGGSVGLDDEAMIEMWKKELGVAVEIQQAEWATYLQDLNQRKYQMWGGSGWVADYPDPEDFLDILFHG